MKVVGGILLAIGLFLTAITFMYQIDTGRTSLSTLIIGILIAVTGFVVLNNTKKPTDKGDK